MGLHLISQITVSHGNVYTQFCTLPTWNSTSQRINNNAIHKNFSYTAIQTTHSKIRMQSESLWIKMHQTYICRSQIIIHQHIYYLTYMQISNTEFFNPKHSQQMICIPILNFTLCGLQVVEISNHIQIWTVDSPKSITNGKQMNSASQIAFKQKGISHSNKTGYRIQLFIK